MTTCTFSNWNTCGMVCLFVFGWWFFACLVSDLVSDLFVYLLICLFVSHMAFICRVRLKPKLKPILTYEWPHVQFSNLWAGRSLSDLVTFMVLIAWMHTNISIVMLVYVSHSWEWAFFCMPYLNWHSVSRLALSLEWLPARDRQVRQRAAPGVEFQSLVMAVQWTRRV